MRLKKTPARASTLAGIAIAVLVIAAHASAHAKLERTTPAADAKVRSPKSIQVHFSEAIETKLSSLKLSASDGTDIAVMAMNDAKDPATLSIMPNAALKPGLYKVTWSVVSDDGHKTHGAFSFTVQ
jgi:copper resistance protein C